MKRKWEYIVEILESIDEDGMLDSAIECAERLDISTKGEYGDKNTLHWTYDYNNSMIYKMDPVDPKYEILQEIRRIASCTEYCIACLDNMNAYGTIECHNCVISKKNGQCLDENSDYAKFIRSIECIMEELE